MEANPGRLAVQVAVDADNGADHSGGQEPEEWLGKIMHAVGLLNTDAVRRLRSLADQLEQDQGQPRDLSPESGKRY
jgi:hypothetical protein